MDTLLLTKENIKIREFVDTPDGGCVALDWAPTKEGLEDDETPTLVVLHGLTGGSHESYIRCLLEVVDNILTIQQ